MAPPGRMFTAMLKLKGLSRMELLLIALSTLNMYTLDTHAIYYEHVVIETNEVRYHIEEDYSLTIEYKGVNHNG